jgi:uncharacterized protein
VYLYATCEHRVWLDLFADRGRQLPDTETERILKARGLEHEAAMAAERGYPRPAHGREDLDAGFAETLALMRAGPPGIYQGVLQADDLVGMPDLLIRQEGASSLGAHHYTVGDVKISRRARSDQALQVAFYAHLLARVQGRLPDRLLLLLGDGREEWFPTEGVGGAFEQALSDLRSIRDGSRPTQPFLKPACGRCPWWGVCGPDIDGRDDLSRVSGMTPARRGVFFKAGVDSVQALASANETDLEKATGIEAPSLRRLIRQARALTEGSPLPVGEAARPAGPPELLVCAFDNPAGDGHTCLLAISYTDPREGPLTARLWAPSAVDEKALYEKALRAFARKPAAPIYHYGPAVPSQFARMETRHGVGEGGLMLLHRMIDVAPLVRRAAALPVSAYGLAAVAAATGHDGELPREDRWPEAWALERGEASARDALSGAADAERAALGHVLGWLRETT